MPQTVAPAATATGAKSFPARILGVIFAPRAAYADVAARPRWLGAMLVVLLVTGGSTFAFLSTEIGKNAMLDQQRQTMESFGVKLNEQAIQRMEEGAGARPTSARSARRCSCRSRRSPSPASRSRSSTRCSAATRRFKQVFAIVVYSGVILVARGDVRAAARLRARNACRVRRRSSVFLPFLEENSFLARFLGSIDLVRVWWFVSLSIGLAVLYRKRTGPIAVTLLVVYAAIALVDRRHPVGAIRSLDVAQERIHRHRRRARRPAPSSARTSTSRRTRGCRSRPT